MRIKSVRALVGTQQAVKVLAVAQGSSAVACFPLTKLTIFTDGRIVVNQQGVAAQEAETSIWAHPTVGGGAVGNRCYKNPSEAMPKGL